MPGCCGLDLFLDFIPRIFRGTDIGGDTERLRCNLPDGRCLFYAIRTAPKMQKSCDIRNAHSNLAKKTPNKAVKPPLKTPLWIFGYIGRLPGYKNATTGLFQFSPKTGIYPSIALRRKPLRISSAASWSPAPSVPASGSAVSIPRRSILPVPVSWNVA